MVTPGPASIVVVDFPFSDLSGSKLRPAVALCSARRGDWLLCQITSNPHSDPDAVKITAANLVKGTLSSISFARPTKLFTANETLMVKRVAILDEVTFSGVLAVIINWLQGVMPIKPETADALAAAKNGDG